MVHYDVATLDRLFVSVVIEKPNQLPLSTDEASLVSGSAKPPSAPDEVQSCRSTGRRPVAMDQKTAPRTNARGGRSASVVDGESHIRGSEDGQEETESEDAGLDRCPQAPPTVPCPGSDGARAGDEPEQAWQAGQPRPGALEVAASPVSSISSICTSSGSAERVRTSCSRSKRGSSSRRPRRPGGGRRG